MKKIKLFQSEPTAPSLLEDKLFNRMEVRIALKAGLAASISLYCGSGLAKLLDRPDYLLSGTWCVLSTFVVLQAHLGGTYRAAWVRFLGVLIGSFMGGLFTSIFGSNAITLGVSVVFTVLICSLFELKESIRISCLSLSVVMILWSLHPSMSPWKFGLYRFMDSTVGILIAVIVSHTIWPAQASNKLRFNIAKTLRYINRLFQLELSLKPTPKHFDRIHRKLIFDIHRLLEESRQFLKESELELLTKSKNLEDWENLLDHLDNIFASTTELSSFHRYNLENLIDKELKEHLYETMEACVSTFKNLNDMLNNAEVIEELTDLPFAVKKLNEELTRFRMTRTTRKYEREDVEHFFVFFYNLRSIIEQLLKMEEKVISLNTQPI